MNQNIRFPRRLVNFVTYDPSLPPLTTTNLVESLRRPTGNGYLIFGGPGSGKTLLLRSIVEELSKEKTTLVVGPVDMGFYHGQTHASFILRDLLTEIVTTGQKHGIEGLPSPFRMGREIFYMGFHSVAEKLFPSLIDRNIEKLVILLDNFDDVHPAAAVRVASELHWLFNRYSRNFRFVLTSEVDLEELHRSVYSPLRGVSESFLLTGLSKAETRQYAQEYISEHPDLGLILTEQDYMVLASETDGYLSLIDSILQLVHKGQKDNPGYTISDAVDEICSDYYNFEPLRTVLRKIEEMYPAEEDSNLAKILRNYAIDNIPPSTSIRGTQMLLALGILTWRGKNSIAWANPIIQKFWKSPSGLKLLSEWFAPHLNIKTDTLSAQGAVKVTLLLDLGWFIPSTDAFERMRGSAEWVEQIRDIARNYVPDIFRPWAEQDHYTTLGHDLNLFRIQVIQSSFTPVFYASVKDLQLDFDERLKYLNEKYADQKSEIEAALHKEWMRWDTAQVQLTRSGAVKVTLIDVIPHSKPISHIMDDLLNLEQEFSLGAGEVQLYIQWELAIGVVSAFLKNIGTPSPACLRNWRVPPIPHSLIESTASISLLGIRPTQEHHPDPVENEDHHLYPSRDRYIIYQFRKLCNCRPGNLLPLEQRRIVTISDLEPVLENNPREKKDLVKALSYGTELATLLEGVMVERQGGEEDHFPPVKTSAIEKILKNDCSSWKNELFTISLDNALIIYNSSDFLPENQLPNDTDIFCKACDRYMRENFRQLHFANRSIPYEDYWQCVSLGLEYLVELRWTAEWVSTQTVQKLAQVAQYMNFPYKERDETQLNRMLEHTAIQTRILSHLREATVPLYIASADYAVDKYEDFIKTSHMREIIKNAEKDIDAINSFVLRDEDQRAQARGDKTNMVLGLVGAALALITLGVALPSLWSDSASGFKFLLCKGEDCPWIPANIFWNIMIVYLVIGISVPILAFLIYNLISKRRRNKGGQGKGTR